MQSNAHRERPIPVIDDDTGITVLGPQEGRRDVERVCQDFAVSDPERAAIERDQTPFMEVGTDSVGVFVDGVEMQGIPKFWYGQGGTGPL